MLRTVPKAHEAGLGSGARLDAMRVALQQVLEQLLRLVKVAQVVLRARGRRRHPLAAGKLARQALRTE